MQNNNSSEVPNAIKAHHPEAEWFLTVQQYDKWCNGWHARAKDAIWQKLYEPKTYFYCEQCRIWFLPPQITRKEE